MAVFVRRYMSDRAHRLLTDETAYCGKRCELGERLSTVAKLARCETCERAYESTPSNVREAASNAG